MQKPVTWRDIAREDRRALAKLTAQQRAALERAAAATAPTFAGRPMDARMQALWEAEATTRNQAVAA